MIFETTTYIYSYRSYSIHRHPQKVLEGWQNWQSENELSPQPSLYGSFSG